MCATICRFDFGLWRDFDLGVLTDRLISNHCLGVVCRLLLNALTRPNALSIQPTEACNPHQHTHYHNSINQMAVRKARPKRLPPQPNRSLRIQHILDHTTDECHCAWVKRCAPPAASWGLRCEDKEADVAEYRHVDSKLVDGLVPRQNHNRLL